MLIFNGRCPLFCILPPPPPHHSVCHTNVPLHVIPVSYLFYIVYFTFIIVNFLEKSVSICLLFVNMSKITPWPVLYKTTPSRETTRNLSQTIIWDIIINRVLQTTRLIRPISSVNMGGLYQQGSLHIVLKNNILIRVGPLFENRAYCTTVHIDS